MGCRGQTFFLELNMLAACGSNAADSLVSLVEDDI